MLLNAQTLTNEPVDIFIKQHVPYALQNPVKLKLQTLCLLGFDICLGSFLSPSDKYDYPNTYMAEVHSTEEHGAASIYLFFKDINRLFIIIDIIVF